jgi:hypothetical protein
MRQLLIGAAALGLMSTLAAQDARFSQLAVLPVAAEMIEASGNRAYTVLGRTVTAFDISNPDAPKRGGNYTFPDKVWGITAVGSVLYAAVDKFGLGILDVGDLAKPTLRASIKTPGQAKSVAIVGTRAFVADHMSGVDFVDITNLAKPALQGSFFLEGYARAVSAVGTVVAAVDSPTGIYLFDATKPGPLEAVGTLQSAERPGSVELSEGPNGRPDLAVLAGGGALQVFEVSNPAAPSKAVAFRMQGFTPLRVALRGRRAYVAGGGAGLQLLDLTTPSAPRMLSSFKTARPARDVAVAGPLVLVATGRPVPPESTVEPTDGELVVLREN